MRTAKTDQGTAGPATAAPGAGADQRPTTMRAAMQDTYGGAEVVRVATREVPAIADDEVLVEVVAAGVDRGVWHLMPGRPSLMRLGFGLTRPRQPVLGLDVAGRVVAVGAAVLRCEVRPSQPEEPRTLRDDQEILLPPLAASPCRARRGSIRLDACIFPRQSGAMMDNLSRKLENLSLIHI